MVKATPPKKIKRKSVWERVKANSHSNDGSMMMDQKERLFSLLNRIAVKKLHRKLCIGANSVMKSVQHGNVSVVCVCRDTPKNLFEPLTEACVVKKVPVVCLPGNSSKDMAISLCLKRASCFSVPNGLKSLADTVLTTDNAGSADDNADCDGIVDGIRETALSMFGGTL